MQISEFQPPVEESINDWEPWSIMKSKGILGQDLRTFFQDICTLRTDTSCSMKNAALESLEKNKLDQKEDTTKCMLGYKKGERLEWEEMKPKGLSLISGRSRRRLCKTTWFRRIEYGASVSEKRNMSYYGDTTDEESDVNPVLIPFFSHEGGSKQAIRHYWSFSNKLYNWFMSYSFYHLYCAVHNHTTKSTNKIHKKLKMVIISLKDHVFIGKEHVLLFDFLASLVEESQKPIN